MNQWRGLLIKEWIQMKSWFYSLLLMGALGIFIIPSALKRLFGIEESIGTISFVIGNTMIFLHSLVAVIMLISTLGKDMARQDIWLHTPASMLKLVLSKVLFTVFITTVSLMFISLIAFGHLLIIIEDKSSNLINIAKLAVFLDGATILTIIYGCCVAFFFWVIYQTLRTKIQSFAGPVTVVLFFFISYWWEKMLSSSFFTRLFSIGELPVRNVIPSDIVKKTLDYDVSIRIPLGYGEIVFVSIFIILLFLVSATWFDKKVRV
jgi:F0F1-type ATP synthase assembly protein I